MKKIIGDDNILKSVNEKETLISNNRHDNESIEDTKTIFLDEMEKLEEALEKIVSERAYWILKTQFPKKRNF